MARLASICFKVYRIPYRSRNRSISKTCKVSQYSVSKQDELGSPCLVSIVCPCSSLQS